MPVFYDPLVVLLSVLVAIQGAVVSLALIHASRAAVALRRRLLVAAAAAAMGRCSASMPMKCIAQMPTPITAAAPATSSLRRSATAAREAWIRAKLTTAP